MLVDENKIKKENFYLFAPELAHASDRVGELELGYQVAFCVPSKGWKKNTEVSNWKMLKEVL